MPITPFIGVRISWLIVARNILFALLAFSASSLAFSAACLDFRSSTLNLARLSVRSFIWCSKISFCLLITRIRNLNDPKIAPKTKKKASVSNHQVLQNGGMMLIFSAVVAGDHEPALFLYFNLTL